ncbi:MAG: lysine--tRNA ligase [Clostridia bacterium]|nr:lysine--tRNA ligase [Clostridia bacterium]
MSNQNSTQANELSLNEVLQIRRDKLSELQASGNNPYAVTKYDFTDYAQSIKDNFEAYENKTVKIAGRMMSRRIMGKASFYNVQDSTCGIQVYVRRDDVGEESYKQFKKYDIGDIVGVEGIVFKTKTGEISVHTQKIELLSKSLLPLPEKFHGLRDLDMRYRQREVDLIMNPEVKDIFYKRSMILKEIRNYLDGKGFLEVDTPILVPLEIGASARPFKTHHNTLDMDMFLRIETELYLKRLIVGGMHRVYEVGRIFRNEGMDTKHNPEFTTIELYQAFTDYYGLMELVEELYKLLADKICGTRRITYQGQEIDLDHWERMTMTEAVKKYSGCDYYSWQSDEDARRCAAEKHVEVPGDATRGTVLAELFDAFVEENLIQPTFIYDYPVENSPLAKRKPDDPAFTERFEYFINATEFGNAFSELNDPIDQRARFEAQVAKKRAEDPNTSAQVDYDFVTALEYGMPPTGGLGFGIDRLVMLLTDSASIREVLLFPTMKPLEGKKDEAEKPAEQSSNAQTEEKPLEKIDFSKVKIEPLFEDEVDFDTFSRSDFRAVKIKDCAAVPKSKKLLCFTLDDGTDTERTILSGIHEYYEPEELIGKTVIAIVNLPPRKMMGIESCGMLISAVYENDGREGLNLLIVDDKIPAGAKLY